MTLYKDLSLNLKLDYKNLMFKQLEFLWSGFVYYSVSMVLNVFLISVNSQLPSIKELNED